MRRRQLCTQCVSSCICTPPIEHHGCGAASAKVVDELTSPTQLSIVRDGKRQDEDEAEEELEEEKEEKEIELCTQCVFS